MKNSLETKLPDKLSDLIEIAIKDLEAVEKNKKKYRVNMEVWFHNDYNERCDVCFAGAVIANRLKYNGFFKSIMDYNGLNWVFPKNISSKLLALNYVREFNIPKAFRVLEIQDTKEIAYRIQCRIYKRLDKDSIDYFDLVEVYKHPKKFKEYMRRIAYTLRNEFGL